jgi:hypothetical protein
MVQHVDQEDQVGFTGFYWYASAIRMHKQDFRRVGKRAENVASQCECLKRNVTSNDPGHSGVRCSDSGQVQPGTTAELDDNPWLYRRRDMMDDVLWV